MGRWEDHVGVAPCGKERAKHVEVMNRRSKERERELRSLHGGMGRCPILEGGKEKHRMRERGRRDAVEVRVVWSDFLKFEGGKKVWV